MARPVVELEGTNLTLKRLENGFKKTNNPRDFVRRIMEAWDNRQGTIESNPSYIENRGQYGSNDSQNRGQGREQENNGLERSSENSSIHQEFRTSLGEVYSFVDKDGNIYLDETIISPNHAIHEYTHFGDRTVAKSNPELREKDKE